MTGNLGGWAESRGTATSDLDLGARDVELFMALVGVLFYAGFCGDMFT